MVGAPEYPGREDEVGKAERVVGVQVREEERAQLGHLQSRYTLARGGGRATDDAGAAVDQITLAIDDDGNGRAGAVGIGVGRPCAEHDDLRDGRGIGEQGAAAYD